MWAGEWAVMVAIGVVAFRDGGTAAVGLVAALRMLPAAAIAPLAASLADAVPRERVLAGVGAVRATTLGAGAVVLATSGPAVAVYALVILATAAQTLYRPAHSALLPSLCASPRELTSANVVRGLLDSLATLGGPLAAAVLLALSGPGAVLAFAGALSLGAGVLAARLRYERPPRLHPPAPRRALLAALDGVRTIGRERTLLLLTSLTTVQTFTRGCLSVLAVIASIELLGTGEPGVGVLNAAVGAGAVLGSLAALGLIGGRHLARWFAIGVALWGAPLALIGAIPEQAAAIVLLGVVGVGNALVDVGAFTLPARLADDAVLARTFAAFEAILTLGVAAGAAVTPVVVGLVDVRGALVVLGLVAPLTAAAAWPALRRLDDRIGARDSEIGMLQRVPMLRAVSQATIEQIAAGLERIEVPGGRVVFEQGEEGELFFVISAGTAEVVRDGRVIGALEPGECFGEIALLHGCVRTATVRASADGALLLLVLSRQRFLTAVTGHAGSVAAGEAMVASRLEDLRGPDRRTARPR
jgi:hypothetical protein